MPQDGEKGTGSGEQQPLPGVPGDDLKAAQRRADDAEKRAAKYEADERKREADAAKRKRDDEIKTTEDAKRALDEALARAEAAEKRAAEADERMRRRIDSRFETLDSGTRERLAQFREVLPIDKWESLVDMEIDRAGGSTDSGGASPDAVDGLPPGSVAGVVRRTHKADGRELHPRTLEILDELGQDPDIARKVVNVETDVEGGVKRGRFIYPQGLLKKHLRERALAPVLMTEENRRKIFGL